MPHPGERTRKNVVWTAICAVLAAVAGALSGSAHAARAMWFENLSLDQGLSQSTVLATYQDSEGFMWFGTENGLNRYDGYAFKHYERDPHVAGSLHDDFIWAIAEDLNRNLWLGTDGGGLARWDRSSDRFTAFRHVDGDPRTISDNKVRALAIDAHGKLWIGMTTKGVDQIDPTTGAVLARFRHDPANEESLSSDEVYALRVDSMGGIWVGTNGGLNRLEPGTGIVRRWRHDPQDPTSLSDDRIRAVFEDATGTIWVGTHKAGLNRLRSDGAGFDRFRHDPAQPGSNVDDRVRAILEDSSDRLWIATEGGLELMDRDAGTFTHYTHDPADTNSLADSRVVSLYQDRSGVLWIGTRSAGISKWNPNAWSFGHYKPDPRSEPQEAANVTSFTEDARGRLWVGSFGGGVLVYDRATGTQQRHRHDPANEASLSDDRVMALLTDQRGDVWAGTMGSGLDRLDADGRVQKRYRSEAADPQSLSADAIMALFEASNGDIWVGTFGGGVSRYDPATDRFVRYPSDPDDESMLGSPRATSFAEDARGSIWVGTDGGGLNLLDATNGRWRRFHHDPNDEHSLSSDTVYSLYVDPAGNLWAGTRAGLDRLVEQEDGSVRFKHLSEEDGLANDVVYGIQSDDSGDLWLSTNHGLSRYNPRNGWIKSYHRSNGLQAEEFNFGAHRRNRSGELLFGGPNGFNAFMPSELALNLQPPPVVLTAVDKLNTPLATDVPYHHLQQLDLGFNDDVVTFEFAALDYTAPESNSYAYMLEGFDADWIEAGKRRRVTYTNLDRGDYVFRVKASNSDGVWNTAGLSLPITVAPAPWETWWAFAGYGLALCLVVFGVFGAQQRKLAREEEYSRRLEHEVKLRTVELEQRNKQLQEASLTDALTGLRNRRFLFEEVSKDVDLVRRIHEDVHGGAKREDVADLVFIMVDLDHFKPINDTCGHAAGDEMLLQVRDALVTACRNSDYVIRWGGDEFLIVGRHANYTESEALAERIRSMIERKVFGLGNGQVAHTTCSIGYACYPFVQHQPDLLTWEQVLGLADRAMYEAKVTRNATVGFRSTATTGKCERLYQRIQQDPQAVANEGFIETRHLVPTPEQSERRA
jgi:diguanylate cyclase (GGDEF)-like protein